MTARAVVVALCARGPILPPPGCAARYRAEYVRTILARAGGCPLADADPAA